MKRLLLSLAATFGVLAGVSAEAPAKVSIRTVSDNQPAVKDAQPMTAPMSQAQLPLAMPQQGMPMQAMPMQATPITGCGCGNSTCGSGGCSTGNCPTGGCATGNCGPRLKFMDGLTFRPMGGLFTHHCPRCGSDNNDLKLPGDARVGILPAFKKLLWWKHLNGVRLCNNCGGMFGGCNNNQCGPQGFNPYPNGVPGTLVYPQHPFVRSPRDFFMWEAK